jgi:uncharacterized membrane protein
VGPNVNAGGSGGSIVKREPATVISAVVGLITAIIGLFVAFGIDVSTEQQNAIIGAVVSLSAVIALLGPVIRNWVYSPASVERIADQQYEAGRPPVEPQPEIPPPGNVHDADGDGKPYEQDADEW